MIKILSRFTGSISKLAAVIGVNFLLFIILPITHNIFSSINVENKELKKQPKIVAEMVKPEKKKEKEQPKRRIRKVQNASARSASSSSNMKFTPDLGVEGGQGVGIANQTMETTVFEEGNTDEDAVPMFTPSPKYPQRAKDLGIEGMVEVIIVVGTNGKVSSIEIVRSPHASFNTEVRKVISTWKFKPARNQGVPVQVRKKQVLDYRLDS
ncbi:MAG: energy transducer TonB [Chitinispirillaceae bacterium]